MLGVEPLYIHASIKQWLKKNEYQHIHNESLRSSEKTKNCFLMASSCGFITANFDNSSEWEPGFPLSHSLISNKVREGLALTLETWTWAPALTRATWAWACNLTGPVSCSVSERMRKEHPAVQFCDQEVTDSIEQERGKNDSVMEGTSWILNNSFSANKNTRKSLTYRLSEKKSVQLWNPQAWVTLSYSPGKDRNGRKTKIKMLLFQKNL